LAITRVGDKFHAQGPDALAKYAELLRMTEPKFAKLEFSRRVAVTAKELSELEVQTLETAVALELEPTLEKKYLEAVRAERDRLVMLAPTRAQALLDNAEAEARRVAEEAAARKAKEDAAAVALQERLATETKAAQADVIFEVAASAEPVVDKSKGTVKKLVYRPTTKGHWVALIQSWMAVDFAELSVEEIEKKLGFALTAANKRLNAGIELDIPQEEDFAVRAASKKKSEAGA
jgi:hypothetical protein